MTLYILEYYYEHIDRIIRKWYLTRQAAMDDKDEIMKPTQSSSSIIWYNDAEPIRVTLPRTKGLMMKFLNKWAEKG